MDTSAKKLKPKELFKWLEHDKDARQDFFDRKKGAFMQRTRERFPAVNDTSNEVLFRRVMSWIASHRCPEELARAAEVYKETRRKTRIAKRHSTFNVNAGVNTPTAEPDAMLESLLVAPSLPRQGAERASSSMQGENVSFSGKTAG
ncbi:hypothetical protein HYPSUDRAFT_216622, partial [Hypholoma sublateritium FD-334 SS-4]